MRNLLNYFFRGLIFVFPVGATIYILLVSISWANSTFNNLLYQLFGIDIPGLGILVVVAAITLTGIFVSLAFTRPIVRFFDRAISKMPLVKIIYTSLKELTEAFVGEKRKFNKPVLVEIHGPDIYKLGFITQNNLEELGHDELVAVYCPHSYNFSGNLFLVHRSKIEALPHNAADTMKYIVSAGVTQLDHPTN